MRARPEIVLVRHGETEWSRAGRHTGRTDLPLTEHGRVEAAAVRELLASRSFARVLTSPLQRATETAALAGFASAEPCGDLVEVDYGAYEGRTTAEIQAERPGWRIWNGRVPDGESLEAVAVRTTRVIERALFAQGDVLLFGHGHCLRILMAVWCGMPPQRGRSFALETGALGVLGWERDDRVVRALNARG